MPARLPRHFFAQSTLRVARALIGCRLVHRVDGRRLSGVIVETEAYVGQRDQASHSRYGRTSRTEVMFGPPGVAYVYFVYGMHWLFNAVTDREGVGAAVLIRALEPLEGVEQMQAHRPFAPGRLCNGPAKLTQALRIDRRHNGVDLCARDAEVWVEAGPALRPGAIEHGPRVGVEFAPEPWRNKPWRFCLKASSFVSR